MNDRDYEETRKTMKARIEEDGYEPLVELSDLLDVTYPDDDKLQCGILGLANWIVAQSIDVAKNEAIGSEEIAAAMYAPKLYLAVVKKLLTRIKDQNTTINNMSDVIDAIESLGDSND